MNSRKGLLRTIVAGVLLTSMLAISSTSQASVATTPKKLNIEYTRKTGYTYRTGFAGSGMSKDGQVMWKIYDYNSNGATVKNNNNAIYCLKMGVGFGFSVGTASDIVDYDIYADMKNPSAADQNIINSYKSTLSKSENYNSLVWVLDHCYVPAPSNSPTTEQIQAATEFKRQLLTDASIPSSSKLYQNSAMNNDLIDIVQQAAIWHFTNNDVYSQPFTNIEYKPLNGTEYEDLDIELAEDLDTLYEYFVNQGEANKNTAPNSTVTNPINFVSGPAKTTLVDDYYISGPYKIEQLSNKSYTLTGMLYDENENSISYQLLDNNKQATTKTLKELVGSEFYLKIPKTANVEKATFKIVTGVKQNTITYWKKEGNNIQPVAEVIPEEKIFESKSILSLSNFDLALRKFITKINDQEVAISREPVITAATKANLKEGIIDTVTKTHTKTPLEVNIGDTVLYTIRIYNEGDISGYATKVTDYLPEGLTLKENSAINREYGWTNPSKDGKTIETTKLANTLLAKFDGTTIDYEDLKIECVVNAGVSDYSRDLKNIAEITDDADENHNPITDRDSTPNNLTATQKNKYNPGTSEKGWGYEDDDDYEELVLPGKSFDLALRKFITNINGEELVDANGKYLREPSIDLSLLRNKASTTAEYKHPKNPIGVAIGDIVTYTLRIYNEGDIDGYVNEVVDHLPAQLEFIKDDETNIKYLWEIDSKDSSRRTIKTSYLSKEIDDEENLIKAFDGTTLQYKELKIKCKVVSTANLHKVITNIADITAFVDVNGNEIRDRDSQAANVSLPADKDLPDYKGNTSNKSVLTDSNYFYKGQQDDDDFEKLILEEFDLALRKFITKVNDTDVTTRIPVFTNVKDQNGNYIYEHTKEPVEVASTDIVEYTLRIYNEGDLAGYAKLIKDDIPEGLEFVPSNSTNIEYRWIMLDKDGNETKDVSKAKYITTDYLSKEQEKSQGDNLIAPFDSTKTSPDYKEVKAAFKVIASNSYTEIITNTAQISDDSDENGNDIKDRDSVPDNDILTEDDIDVEHLKLKYFDLALRKFITGVNDKSITDRVPVFKITEDGKYVYEHTKEPVEVVNGDIVTYTIRVYNEGTIAGYAKEVKDDLPQGLEYLPENSLNKEYRWVMLDEKGEVTQDIKKAVSIKTDYLSKEQADATSRDNLLDKFNADTMTTPNYKDVKIAFKVTEPNTSDRILINKAQISNDSDKDGKDITDIDSTPDKWIEGEDDQDIEKVKVKYFDLALRKWVTEAIVIDNGEETVTETGHHAEDDPEEVVKVELKESKINKVVVKFRYKIRITNEGEIAGYAKEISDYIPEGLKFVQADNPEWTEVDGKIVTDQLKDTLLQPKETAEVEVLLTWINSKDNFGLKVNVAEISKDYNDSNTPDIDSTPNNKVPGEDDIDDAPVILSVKTGTEVNMGIILLTAGSLTILATGVILIKKYIL